MDVTHRSGISAAKVTALIATKNAVATSLMLANGNLFGVAITPDGTRAYVAASNSKIYVLDTATNQVIDTVSSDEPGGLAIRRAM